MADEILVNRQDGVLELTLNRPDQLNAFNPAMHGLLRAALEEARDDQSCRVVLLTGAGRGFSAGQDLGDRDPSKMDGPPDLGHTIDTYYNPLIRLIRSLEKPVICAVNGVAAGAGANIALSCDLVIAKKSAKFIQAFCKLGLVPDSGGTFTVTRLIGEARAKALMLTGEPIMAEEAERIGMIWKAVEDDHLMDEARRWANHFSSAPTFGLSLVKKAVHAAATNTLDEQLDLERDFQRRAGRTPDYREGVTAFLEKRKPVFRGTEE
ncbi:MAG: 2-(1,2-epoxy-1,2-dihydrophenyl)acetyl-CoA isomerase PaaG [Pseudomonadota bacterium]